MSFINIGYIQDIVIVGPMVIPGVTGCIDCQNLFSSNKHATPVLDNLLRKINSSNRSPSIGPINMIAAGMAALDIIKYLSDCNGIMSLNKKFGFWTNKNEIEIQKCEINKDCKTCGHLSNV